MVIKRGFFLISGILSLCMGLLGIVLPVLPTVPFILLAAFCFARSSERLHDWLHRHPWFAQPLNDWHARKAMRKKLKRKALLITGASFSLSIALVPLGWVKLLLAVCGICLLLFLWQIPELEDSE
ncbi:inner membrane protein [Shewanella carassii]|uniref:YbaN family protein n=1 Tax=Shewanella carassii TaxID=1987584 RepID=UPI001BF155C3|nr:YbaN family protein [Shewanella carassii]BCV66158.1 inner membrane protein [Shewanella carassii]